MFIEKSMCCYGRFLSRARSLWCSYTLTQAPFNLPTVVMQKTLVTCMYVHNQVVHTYVRMHTCTYTFGYSGIFAVGVNLYYSQKGNGLSAVAMQVAMTAHDIGFCPQN